MKEIIKRSGVTWGILVPGCMFVGIGLGMLFGDAKSGLFLGMGAGLVLTGIIHLGARGTNKE